MEEEPEQRTELLNEFLDAARGYLRLLEQIHEGTSLHFLSTPSKDDQELINNLTSDADFHGKLMSLVNGHHHIQS